MKSWQQAVVSAITPVREAIRVMDEAVLQIVFVAEEDYRLQGTVTDGDIRRGLLRGVTLDMPVREIMNPHPITVGPEESRDHLPALMQLKHIRQLPVLDENGCIVRVEFLEELIQPSWRDNPVVLMAGGLGSRLRPLTEDCPKPLLKVGTKPILETILGNFIEYGFHRFYLAVNYKAEMIESHFGDGSRWGVEIQYIREQQQMGTAGALSLLPEAPELPVLVMNGDLLTKVNFAQLSDFHTEHRAQATICVREYDFQVPYGVVTVENHCVRAIEEKPVQRFLVNAGIYVLDPNLIRNLARGERIDMTTLLEDLMRNKCDVAAFPVREYWLDIGQMDDFERANSEFREHFSL